MTSSSSAPKLPLWVFFVTDAVLLAVAVGIAMNRPHPWSEGVILAIVACILAGAAILFVPLVARYERVKNETLDDRQRALEALARTISSSAEQISIAATGLHEITEIAQRNLKHAEQLPHKLQEKIAEFQAQLANANDAEKEELEKEVQELRSSETDRMETLADRITRTTGELAKLEATLNQHLAGANEALGKLALGTAGAIGKAEAAAEQAMAQARKDAARTLGEASGEALKSLEAAKTSALSEFKQQVDVQVSRLEAVTKTLANSLGRLETAAAGSPVPSTAAAAPKAEADVAPQSIAAMPEIAAAESAAAEPVSPTAETVASPPKRARKPRREEPSPVHETPAPSAAEPAPSAKPDETAPSPSPAPSPEEPRPIASETIPEVTPVAPATAQPFAIDTPPTAETAAPATPAESTASPDAAPTSAEPPKPARKRPAKRTDDDQPGLGLDIEASSPGSENGEGGAPQVESVLTSDGATRLIVTAYIGIGNRLFIRGSGPGLAWDKGVPLQFVSIGKWRWETLEANGAVRFKLLKNDEQECAALGEQTIEPGHQTEVTAAF